MDNFQTELKDQLAKLGLIDYDVYGPYVMGILEDSTSPDSEKKEGIKEFLSSATDKDLTKFVDDLLVRWSSLNTRKSTKQEKQAAQKDVLAELKKDLKAVSVSSDSATRLTREEKEEQKKKEALLSKYGFDVQEVNADGELMLQDNSDGPANVRVEANRNASKVAEAEHMKRERSKAEHAAQQARNKEQQAREAAKREKEKQRTQKQERKGRGN